MLTRGRQPPPTANQASAVASLARNQRRDPLYRASQAICAALDAQPRVAPGPPSRRTRARSTHGNAQLHHEPTRQRARDHVRRFARALQALPLRDGGAIRRVGHASLATPAAAFQPHGSGSSLLEHHGLLPRLQSAIDADDATPATLHASYAAQRKRRARGGSRALWQLAEAGAVTLPHVDDDLHGTTMSTYLIVTRGVELIVAWRRSELHEDDALRAMPSLELLRSVPSLTVVRASAGDVVFMPRDAVHMVVTEARKVHLAFHVY